VRQAECTKKVGRRVADTLAKIEAQPRSVGNVLFVSHASPIEFPVGNRKSARRVVALLWTAIQYASSILSPTIHGLIYVTCLDAP
jgi:broad specificity phosphatase PhoE